MSVPLRSGRIRFAFALVGSLAGSGCVKSAAPPRPDTSSVAPQERPVAAAAKKEAPAPHAGAPELASVPVEGSPFMRLRAVVVVEAPLEAVRATLFDFEHYPEFLPNYRAAKITGRTPAGGHEVAMDIDELGGLIKLRVLVAIAPASIAGGVETYDGKLVRGNVRTFDSRWQLERVDERSTRLGLESWVNPDLPIPASFINRGSLDGIRDAILAIKARAERQPRP